MQHEDRLFFAMLGAFWLAASWTSSGVWWLLHALCWPLFIRYCLLQEESAPSALSGEQGKLVATPLTDAPLLPSEGVDIELINTRAFLNYPPFLYIFQGGEAARFPRLRWLISRFVAIGMHKGVVHTCRSEPASGRSEILASATWLPPGKEVSILDLVRFGLLAFPFRCGVGALVRGIYVLGTCDWFQSMVAPATTGPAYLFFDYLAVRVGYQGRGFGSNLLQHSIERWRADLPAGTAVMFNTCDPRDVPFYQKNGAYVLD